MSAIGFQPSAQSESLPCSQRLAKAPRFLQADNEDWTDPQANLSSLGAHASLLVLSRCGLSSCCGSMI